MVHFVHYNGLESQEGLKLILALPLVLSVAPIARISRRVETSIQQVFLTAL